MLPFSKPPWGLIRGGGGVLICKIDFLGGGYSRGGAYLSVGAYPRIGGISHKCLMCFFFVHSRRVPVFVIY